MTAIEKLCAAIGYPHAPRASAAGEAALVVDGAEVFATTHAGRLILWRVLGRAEELGDGALARLAGYAAGRVLKEEATLAWDPRRDALVLWQAAPEAAEAAQLRLLFEVFCTSCDWWAARVHEQDRESAAPPEMVILP